MGNTAFLAGAVGVFTTLSIQGIVGSMLTFKGSNIIQNNTAVGIIGLGLGEGGALFVDFESSVVVEGRLCASGNRALSGGGFAWVIGQLLFASSSQVFFNDNTLLGTGAPNTIALFTSGSSIGISVQCGEGSPSWLQDRTYTIRGPACACNESFVAGNSTTCDTPFPDCGPTTWDQDACACVSVRGLGCQPPAVLRVVGDQVARSA